MIKLKAAIAIKYIFPRRSINVLLHGIGSGGLERRKERTSGRVIRPIDIR